MDSNVKQGSILRDNDPRSEGRMVTVLRVVNRDGRLCAEYQAGHRRAYIRIDRIFTDGTRHKTGWSLVS